MAYMAVNHFMTLSFLAASLAVSSAPVFAMSKKVSSSDAVQASAILLDADRTERGTAKLTQTADGVDVSVKVSGLQPGSRGIHIHTVGECTAPDFASAGGHWNPTRHEHGVNNPKGPHRGDMPNLVIDAKGTGAMDFSIPRATLKGGDAPLLDADGASIVIHTGPDDMRTDPSGNSGGREVCGVIAAK